MTRLYQDNRYIKCLALLFILLILVYFVYLHSGFRSKLADTLFNVSLKTLERTNSSNEGCSGYGRNTSLNLYEKCIKRFPDCLIIGVEKAGTYALLKFLGVHPQIVRNEAYDEVYFFDRNYAKGFDWYMDKMPYSLPGQVVIEKTPSYFFRQEVPARVFKFKPDIRLLLIVRNPVERSISAYAMDKERHHGFMKPFEKFIIHPSGMFEPSSPFIQHSMYDYYLERWLKYFNLKQVHIVDGDSFSQHPVKELGEIEKFLGVDKYFSSQMFIFNSTKGFYCFKGSAGRTYIDCLKKSKGRKHPSISANVIRKMKDHFSSHNKRFYNMTGTHFKWNS